MLNTEDKSRLSCTNSYSNSCYWVNNTYSFLNLSCCISIMFPILSSGFYCDTELQELPLVHEVIFEKHMD